MCYIIEGRVLTPGSYFVFYFIFQQYYVYCITVYPFRNHCDQISPYDESLHLRKEGASPPSHQLQSVTHGAIRP